MHGTEGFNDVTDSPGLPAVLAAARRRHEVKKLNSAKPRREGGGHHVILGTKTNICQHELEKLSNQLTTFNNETVVVRESKKVYGTLRVEDVYTACSNKSTFETKFKSQPKGFFLSTVRLFFDEFIVAVAL